LLDSIAQDGRFGLRQMRRNPGFTAVALLAISVGIGANSAVLSFFRAIHSQRPSVDSADDLIVVQHVNRRDIQARDDLSADQYAYYRQHAAAFTGLAAQNWTWTWLSNGERSAEWRCGQVSANYFDVLGVGPHRGAFFAGEHDTSSVVLSHRAWSRTFERDRDVVGRTVRLNQQVYTVIGVAPENFGGVYLGDSLDLWMLHERPDGVVVGRLRPGRTPADARAELMTLSARFGEKPLAGDQHATVVVEALRGVHPSARRAVAAFPVLLGATTICLLAIACANLAGLLLARADARRHEIALRLSLGASRSRIARQLLTESILLSVVGGLLGLALALHGCAMLEQFFGYQIPDLRLILDPQIVGISIALSLATGIAFGVAPAWQATRKDPTVTLRRRPLGFSAIAVQIALSTVLVIAAALLVQSMEAVLDRPGLDPDKVAHFRLRPSRLGYSLEQGRTYQRDLLRAIEAVPGVERAVVARVPPDRGWCCEIDVSRPGEQSIKVEQNEVSPGFLPTLGIPVVAGRDFADGDRNVAIVNQSLAETLWPAQSALDRDLWVDQQPYRVIGVAADVHAVPAGASAQPYLYLPMWGRDARDPRLFVRVNGRAAPMLERLRREIVAVNPDVHVGQESTLWGRTAMSYQRERMLAAVLEFAGSIAVLLSAIGVCGLAGYQVSRRTKEIGIRMALGAQVTNVIIWVMRRGLIASGAGLAAGLVISWQTTRLLTTYLYGVQPLDIVTFGGAAVLLALIAVAASLVPARAAARIDPAVALREQ